MKEHALAIFNLRTYLGYEEIPKGALEIGMASENFLVEVQTGETTIEIGTLINVSPPIPLAARNRDGTTNVSTAADQVNTIGAFSGGAWDWV